MAAVSRVLRKVNCRNNNNNKLQKATQKLITPHVVDDCSLLLLTDDSQAAAMQGDAMKAFEAIAPEIKHVALREVMRSTKRIVAGSAHFQVGKQRTSTCNAYGMTGPPMKTFVFPSAESENERDQQYASNTMRGVEEAVEWAKSQFPAVSIDNNLAIVGPNTDFVRKLKSALPLGKLKAVVGSRVRLVSAVEAAERPRFAS